MILKTINATGSAIFGLLSRNVSILIIVTYLIFSPRIEKIQFFVLGTKKPHKTVLVVVTVEVSDFQYL